MVASLNNLSIETHTIPLNQLHVELDRDRDQINSRKQLDRHTRILLPDGRRTRVSGRFWSSFSALYGLNRSAFDYFTHSEVFDRVTQVRKDEVRVSIEHHNDSNIEPRLLSLTNPTKPVLRLEELQRLVDEFDGDQVSYADGVASASFDCPYPLNFTVAGDDFRTRFAMDMPLDGYGMPAAFLAVLRLVCTNGMVGMSRAFKTSFQLGKDDTNLYGVLGRAMATFNNEEGYASFRQRIEASTQSWASLHEAISLHRILSRGCLSEGFAGDQKRDLIDSFMQACGNPLAFYGLANGHELSERRARAIPIDCTVYDLTNVASEASTHHFHNLSSRTQVNAWLGQMLTREYDLEGTVEQFPDFRDYFLSNKRGADHSDPADQATLS